MAQKILVIDDDLFIREIYEDILRRAGYEVDSAINGLIGLKKVQNGGYDLILLDVVMPELDGLGVLTCLENNPPAEKNGPIILLTNSNPDSVVEKALQKGATSYFIKAELAPDQLLNEINKILT